MKLHLLRYLAAGRWRWQPASLARAASQDETGASLIIALFFITVVAVTITALITFAGGALVNTANLKTQRSVEYAADTGTDTAIQAVRYKPTAYDKITGQPLTAPTKCFGPATFTTSGPGTPTPTSNQRTVVVYCRGRQVFALPRSTKQGAVDVSAGATTVTTSSFFGGSTTRFVGFKVTDTGGAFPTTTTVVILSESTTGTVKLSKPAAKAAPGDTLTVTPIYERTVTFFTCVAKDTTVPTCPALSTGKPNYLIHAVAAFDDVKGSTWLCGTGHAATPTCGTAMSLEQWIVEPANG